MEKEADKNQQKPDKKSTRQSSGPDTKNKNDNNKKRRNRRKEQNKRNTREIPPVSAKNQRQPLHFHERRSSGRRGAQAKKGINFLQQVGEEDFAVPKTLESVLTALGCIYEAACEAHLWPMLIEERVLENTLPILRYALPESNKCWSSIVSIIAELISSMLRGEEQIRQCGVTLIVGNLELFRACGCAGIELLASQLLKKKIWLTWQDQTQIRRVTYFLLQTGTHYDSLLPFVGSECSLRFHELVHSCLLAELDNLLRQLSNSAKLVLHILIGLAASGIPGENLFMLRKGLGGSAEFQLFLDTEKTQELQDLVDKLLGLLNPAPSRYDNEKFARKLQAELELPARSRRQQKQHCNNHTLNEISQADPIFARQKKRRVLRLAANDLISWPTELIFQIAHYIERAEDFVSFGLLNKYHHSALLADISHPNSFQSQYLAKYVTPSLTFTSGGNFICSSHKLPNGMLHGIAKIQDGPHGTRQIPFFLGVRHGREQKWVDEQPRHWCSVDIHWRQGEQQVESNYGFVDGFSFLKTRQHHTEQYDVFQMWESTGILVTEVWENKWGRQTWAWDASEVFLQHTVVYY